MTRTQAEDALCRRARREDCVPVYRLICQLESWELPFERFRAIYEEQLADGRYCCLVHVSAGTVDGVVNLRFEEQLHHAERAAEILELAVAAGHRGRGVGKELLSRACRLAVEAGCARIEAACNRRRTDAHRFYLREGMEDSHIRFSRELAEQAGDPPAEGAGSR